MKKLWLIACTTLTALPALAADVGVSISVSEPGVYGRIDIGRFPQPQVIQAQPVIVQMPAVVVAQPQPVYLWVPPGHRKDWRRYCHNYGACTTPVYFVQDGWYEQRVMPAGRGGGKDKGRGNGNGNGKGHGKNKHGD